MLFVLENGISKMAAVPPFQNTKIGFECITRFWKMKFTSAWKLVINV